MRLRSSIWLLLISVLGGVVAVPGLSWAAQPAAALADSDAQSWLDRVRIFIGDDVFVVAQRIALGLLLFLAGWIVAKTLAWAVYRLLRNTEVDNQLASKLGLGMVMSTSPSQPHQLERVTARVVYYMLMLLVVVGVLQYAGLSQAAEPIESFVGKVTTALPHVGKAILILGVAYAAGIILQKLVTGGLRRIRLDERFRELSAPGGQNAPEAALDGEERPFSEAVGRVLFWLLMVAGLAGAVDALEIEPLAEPLRNGVDRIVNLLPSVAVASLILIAGYALGVVARAILDNLLDSAGLNRLADRLGLSKLAGSVRPSAVVGWAAMVFILLQATIEALDELSLDTLSAPLTAMMAQIWNLLPVLAVSIVTVAAGVVAGKLLRAVAERSLQAIEFDRLMERIGIRALEQREGRLSQPHQLVGLVVQTGIILAATVQALDNLGLDTWARYVDNGIEYAVTRLAVALVIVGVGMGIGNYVRDLVLMRRRAEDDETVAWVATFARYTVLVFTFTMAIHHLDIGQNFVLVAFSLLFGSLCLAMALALGLGAREVVGDVVRRQYDKARDKARSQGDGDEPGAA